MKGLTIHVMNSTNTNTSGYASSEMYTYIHNTVLPNLRRSGLNITACDLVSVATYNDICTKTGMTSASIAGGERFWLADINPGASNAFYGILTDCIISSYTVNDASRDIGVRPLITVVK